MIVKKLLILASLLILGIYSPPSMAQTVIFGDNFDAEIPGFNYNDFAHWDVTEGSVDLWYSLGIPPIYDKYVDLDGTTQNAGTLVSKTDFEFNPGFCYGLSFDLAGSQRYRDTSDATDTLTVYLGSIYNRTFTLAWDTPFQTFDYVFTVDSTTYAPLIFEHAGGDDIGILLDNVKVISAPDTQALTQNLIGYWKFDGDGTDASEEGNDLSLYGGVGFATGLYGQALDLHYNSSQYAQRLGDDQIYDFGDSDFTIQVWVKLNRTDTEQVLIEKFSDSNGPGWTLTYYDRHSSFNRDWHFYALPSMRLYTSREDLDLEQWHQVVVRKSGTGIGDIDIFYDNNITEYDFPHSYVVPPGTIPDTNYPLFVGRRNPDGQNFPLDGRIDEVAIWNRALSNCEIALLWNDGDGYEILPSYQAISLDIKPQSCPNPLNTKSKGVLPVAILGTEDFDVLDVDISTIVLAGVAPIRDTLEDVATPFNGASNDDCLDCTEVGPDGFVDIILHFDTQDIVDAIGPVSDGNCVELHLTGELLDGRPLEATDSVIVLSKGGKSEEPDACLGCIPKTGQTTPYGSRDDGELQKGVAWPEKRFIDNKDGTVTDKLTCLMWTKNANIYGATNWSDALASCNSCTEGGDGGWRLPNVRELQTLLDYGVNTPALPIGNPFTNVQSDYYWSSTTHSVNTNAAWRVSFHEGTVRNDNKDSTPYNEYVWCVRDAN